MVMGGRGVAGERFPLGWKFGRGSNSLSVVGPSVNVSLLSFLTSSLVGW